MPFGRSNSYRKSLNNHTNKKKYKHHNKRRLRSSKIISRFKGIDYTEQIGKFDCDGDTSNSKILSTPDQSGSNTIALLTCCNNKCSIVKLSYIIKNSGEDNISKLYRELLRPKKANKYSYDDLEDLFKNIDIRKYKDLMYVDSESLYYEPVICESLIYKYLNRAIKYNISPHIIQYYGSNFITYETITKNMSKNDIKLLEESYLEKNIKLNKNSVFYIQNTKYDIEYDIITLEKLLDKIKLLLNKDIILSIKNVLDIILFQVFYTLECFKIMGVKHNDLHNGNILIYIRKNGAVNTISKLIENYRMFIEAKKFNRYIYKDETFDIPDIGVYVKIYDFDFSCKFKKSIDDVEILTDKILDFELFGVALSSNDNSYDLFKFIMGILNIKSKIDYRNIFLKDISKFNKFNKIYSDNNRINKNDVLDFFIENDNSLHVYEYISNYYNNIISQRHTYYYVPYLNMVSDKDDITIILQVSCEKLFNPDILSRLYMLITESYKYNGVELTGEPDNIYSINYYTDNIHLFTKELAINNNSVNVSNNNSANNNSVNNNSVNNNSANNNSANNNSVNNNSANNNSANNNSANNNSANNNSVNNNSANNNSVNNNSVNNNSANNNSANNNSVNNNSVNNNVIQSPANNVIPVISV